MFAFATVRPPIGSIIRPPVIQRRFRAAGYERTGFLPLQDGKGMSKSLRFVHSMMAVAMALALGFAALTRFSKRSTALFRLNHAIDKIPLLVFDHF